MLLKINPHLKKLVQDVVTSRARRHWEHNAGSLSSPCTAVGQGQVIIVWVRLKKVLSTQTNFSFVSVQCACNPVCDLHWPGDGKEVQEFYLYEVICFRQIANSNTDPSVVKTISAMLSVGCC